MNAPSAVRRWELVACAIAAIGLVAPLPALHPHAPRIFAAIGLIGATRLASRATHGRLALWFAALGFAIGIGLTPAPITTPIIAIFATGGLLWGLTRATGRRVARILAVLFSVLAGAFGVAVFSAEVGEGTGRWLRAAAAGIAALALLVALLAPPPASEGY